MDLERRSVLSAKGLGLVLHVEFDGELPGKEDNVLDIINPI